MAAREILEDPERRLLNIMEFRNYARAWAAVNAMKPGDAEPKSPMVGWVKKVQAERFRLLEAEGHGR